MSRDEIVQNIHSLLRQNRSKVERLNEDTAIADFRIDSVRMTGFLMDVEEFFKVLVPDQEWAKWQKVADMVNYIEGYLIEAENLNPIDIEIVTRQKPDMPEE